MANARTTPSGANMRQGRRGRSAIASENPFDKLARMAASVHQFWVFGYGSLMWNPGFHYIERQQAIVHGFHRSLCMYSYMYRGTPERPGLVLGLDRGGACHGVAFRVAAEEWAATIAY